MGSTKGAVKKTQGTIQRYAGGTCEVEEALTTDQYTLGSNPVRSEAEGDL